MLTDALLSGHDVGSSWSSQPGLAEDVQNGICTLLPDIPYITQVGVAYQKSGKHSYLYETIALYTSANSEMLLNSERNALSTCQTVLPLKSLSLGDEEVGYSQDSASTQSWILMFRRGDVVALLNYIGERPIDVAAAERLARLADTKVKQASAEISPDQKGQ